MRQSARSGWFRGFVVGITAGSVTPEFPSLGWLLVAGRPGSR
jgi:hypothetical protein